MLLWTNDLSFRENGTVVPLGKGIETGVDNPDGYTLNYNGTYFVSKCM